MHYTIAITSALTTALAVALPRTANKRETGLKFIGVNEAAAEFRPAVQGVYGTDYTWPNLSSIDGFVLQGFNTFRVNTLMERFAPQGLTSALDEWYLGNLTVTVNHITDLGAHAMIDLHNYGRYRGSIIESVDDFRKFWKAIATVYKDNDLVIFDTNNEVRSLCFLFLISPSFPPPFPPFVHSLEKEKKLLCPN